MDIMDYAAELRARGAAPIHAFAIALRGKQALVKLLQPAKPRRRPSR